MSEFSFPKETVKLPSKGLLYPEDSPLSKGEIEMKYMTAREEDILTNQSYIQKNTVLDKLLESLIVTEGVNLNDLVVGDKNALLVAARVLGYGKDYTFSYGGEEHTVDLSSLDNKEFDEENITKGVNEFSFTLPHSQTTITYKLLTGAEEKKIERELAGLKKINKEASPELTTRLKYLITSVNGETDPSVIRKFVDNHLLAMDSRALREHIKQTQPDVDLTFINDQGEVIDIPINLTFFWPDV